MSRSNNYSSTSQYPVHVDIYCALKTIIWQESIPVGCVPPTCTDRMYFSNIHQRSGGSHAPCMEGSCTVRSYASCVMVTWGTPSDRHTHVKTLYPRLYENNCDRNNNLHSSFEPLYSRSSQISNEQKNVMIFFTINIQNLTTQFIDQ